MHSVRMPERFDYQPGYRAISGGRRIFPARFYERKPARRQSEDFCPLPATCSPTRPGTAANRARICVWHPHGTTETEAWRFFLVDADAPAYVKDVLRRFYMRYPDRPA